MADPQPPAPPAIVTVPGAAPTTPASAALDVRAVLFPKPQPPPGGKDG